MKHTFFYFYFWDWFNVPFHGFPIPQDLRMPFPNDPGSQDMEVVTRAALKNVLVFGKKQRDVVKEGF